MDAAKVGLVVASGVVASGFAAIPAGRAVEASGDEQPTPGRSVARSAVVGLATAPLGLLYMYPFAAKQQGSRKIAMTLAGGLQFAATAGTINYMNHNGTLHGEGRWNSTLESAMVSSVLGGAFGAAGAALGGMPAKRIATWGAIGLAGGFPDGATLHMMNRPDRNGLADLGNWAKDTVGIGGADD